MLSPQAGYSALPLSWQWSILLHYTRPWQDTIHVWLPRVLCSLLIYRACNDTVPYLAHTQHWLTWLLNSFVGHVSHQLLLLCCCFGPLTNRPRWRGPHSIHNSIATPFNTLLQSIIVCHQPSIQGQNCSQNLHWMISLMYTSLWFSQHFTFSYNLQDANRHFFLLLRFPTTCVHHELSHIFRRS